MISKRLQMVFKNEGNSNVTLTVDDPREDITSDEVKTAMETIVEKDVFKSKTGRIVSVHEAKIVSTQVTKLEV